MRSSVRNSAFFVLAAALLVAHVVSAQPAPSKTGHSKNIHELSHLELGQFMTVGGIAIEQELNRPYVYVDRWHDQDGFDVLDIKDPAAPKVIARWRIEHPELHRLSRGETGKYFKTRGHYYYMKATEFERGTLDSDLGAVVLDVTDPAAPKEVARVRSPEFVDGFVNVFPYRHSDGRMLVFAAVRTFPDTMAPHANV